jgi:rod shape-determining protein MreD
VIVTPKIFARLAGVVVLAVLLQLCFFSQVALFDASPDVLPAVVVALGLLGGTMTGVVSGFAVGFLLDCLLVQPLGASSLVLLGVGYAAGFVRERVVIQSQLLPLLLCMGLTFAAELGFGAVQLTLGSEGPVSLLAIREILLQSIFAFFLGWPIYAGLRRLLRPALVEEPAVSVARRPTALRT